MNMSDMRFQVRCVSYDISGSCRSPLKRGRGSGVDGYNACFQIRRRMPRHVRHRRVTHTRISGTRFRSFPGSRPLSSHPSRHTLKTPSRHLHLAVGPFPFPNCSPVDIRMPAKLAPILRATPLASGLTASYHTIARVPRAYLRPSTIPTRRIGQVTQTRMASDDAYAAFLEQANQDPMKDRTHAAATRPNRELKSVDEGEEVPKVLGDATKGKFYVSDADEGFLPVCLRWKGEDLPDEGLFRPSQFLFLSSL